MDEGERGRARVKVVRARRRRAGSVRGRREGTEGKVREGEREGGHYGKDRSEQRGTEIRRR